MKSNVLLITADQWRGDCLSAVGHPVVRTPHLDALAREGVLFARHYAGAAPCSPARASLYTGLYQMNNRVCTNGSPLDSRFDTIALAARRAGYDPTLFGYTDISPDPRDYDENDPHLRSYEGILPGFTVRQLLPENERPWLSWLRARGHDNARDGAIHRAVGNDDPSKITSAPPAYSKDETQTAFLAGEFIRWSGEQDSPWFAHVSFLRPHPPFVVPEPYNTMFSAFDGPDLAGPATSDARAALHPFVAFALATQKRSSFIQGATGLVSDWTGDDLRAIRAIYYGMIAEVDAQIGCMIDALKEQGHWDNTIVVFASDHGEMAGDHRLLGKGGFFEASYHIPLIIRDPAASSTAGRRVDLFTAAADVMPTLCERLNVTPRNHIDGQSLMPFITGQPVNTWRDAAFWEFDFRDIENGRSESHFGLPSHACNLAVLRDDRFKYVHFAGLPPLLFDMLADPQELTDLSQDPAYLSIRLAFAEKMLSQRARHLDQTLADLALTNKGVVRRKG